MWRLKEDPHDSYSLAKDLHPAIGRDPVRAAKTSSISALARNLHKRKSHATETVPKRPGNI